MDRPFKELRIYALTELISQTNDEMTRLDRLRNNMQVVTFASSHLRAALSPGDYEDLRLSADTLVEKIQRGQKGLSDRLSQLTTEASMRDFEEETRKTDEEDAGQLRGRLVRDAIKILRFKMKGEGATEDQILTGDWRDDELAEIFENLHTDVESALDEDWNIRKAELGDAT